MSHNLFAVISTEISVLTEDQHKYLTDTMNASIEDEDDERIVYEVLFNNRDWSDELQSIFDAIDQSDEAGAITFTDEIGYQINEYGSPSANGIKVRVAYEGI